MQARYCVEGQCFDEQNHWHVIHIKQAERMDEYRQWCCAGGQKIRHLIWIHGKTITCVECDEHWPSESLQQIYLEIRNTGSQWAPITTEWPCRGLVKA